MLTGLYGMAGSKGYDPAVIAKIAALPGVRHVSSYADLNVELLEPGQNSVANAGSQGLSGSVDGEFFSTDRKVAYSSEETQDDSDVQRDGGALFTPALTRLLERCCANFTETAVQLAAGTSLAAAEASIQRLLPQGSPSSSTSRRRPRRRRSGPSSRRRSRSRSSAASRPSPR